MDVFIPKLTEDKIEKTIDKLQNLKKGEESKNWFDKFVKAIKAENEKKIKNKKDDDKDKKAEVTASVIDSWQPEEINLLTKGIIKYPVGLQNRWESIQKFIGGKKSVEEVMTMVNELKCKNIRGVNNLQNQVEKVLQKNLENKNKKVEEVKANNEPENDSVWSQDEQKLLEKALKTYPASMEAQERWGKIAEMVGNGRTKKEC